MELSEKQQDLAVALASEGKTQKEIREAVGISQMEFWKYRERNPSFKARYTQARQEGLEELADSLQSIPDDYADVQQARLKSDNLRWILSKRKPHVYGDRIDVNVNQTVDIGLALEEARKRALPKRDLDGVIDAECSEITDKKIEQLTGSKPAGPKKRNAGKKDDADIY